MAEPLRSVNSHPIPAGEEENQPTKILSDIDKIWLEQFNFYVKNFEEKTLSYAVSISQINGDDTLLDDEKETMHKVAGLANEFIQKSNESRITLLKQLDPEVPWEHEILKRLAKETEL